MKTDSYRSLRVEVSEINDGKPLIKSLGSLVTIHLQRGANRSVEFRFLLNCGACVIENETQRVLSSPTAQILSERPFLLQSIDGILLTGHSLYESGGLPILFKLLEHRNNHNDDSTKDVNINYDSQQNRLTNKFKSTSTRTNTNDHSILTTESIPSYTRRLPPIYCTEPTSKFGKLLLYDELIHIKDQEFCQFELHSETTNKNTHHQSSLSTLHSNKSGSLSLNPNDNPRHLSPVVSRPLESTSSSISLDHVDSAFDRCIRVKYKEYVFLRKKEIQMERKHLGNSSISNEDQFCNSMEDRSSKNPTTNDDVPFQTITLSLRAYPSGHSLGGSVWYLSTDDYRSSILLTNKFSTHSNWFFDGLNCLNLPRSPSIVVSSVPFLLSHTNPFSSESQHIPSSHPSTDPSTDPLISQICSRIPSLPNQLEYTAASHLISMTRQTLKRGGSVLIPMELSTSALKLLLLFEASWSPVLRVYPIIFISPTGSVLIDFAKTMIGWMSFNIRDEFAKTRRNLFHNFQYITTVTSPTEALQIAPNIPKVFISTPVALNQGFTAKLFLQICSNPLSLVILLHSISPFEKSLFPSIISRTSQRIILDVNELQSRSLPTDKLYDLYLKRQGNQTDIDGVLSSALDGPISESPGWTDPNPIIAEVNSEKKEITDESLYVDFAAIMNEKMGISNNIGKQIETYIDDYGTSIQMVDVDICPVTVDETGLWSAGVSAKRIKSFQESGIFEDNLLDDTEMKEGTAEGNGDDDGINLDKQRDEKSQALPHWRRQLRQWNNGKDPVEYVPTFYQLPVTCKSIFIPEVFGTDDHMRILDGQSFIEWVFASLRPLRARKFIFLPSSIHSTFMKSLLRSCLSIDRHFADVVVCERFTLGTETSVFPNECPNECLNDSAEVDPVTQNGSNSKQCASAEVEWNESIVELDQPIWDFLKSQGHGTLSPEFREIPVEASMADDTLNREEAHNKSKKEIASLNSTRRWHSHVDVMYLELTVDEKSTEDQETLTRMKVDSCEMKTSGLTSNDEKTETVSAVKNKTRKILKIFIQLENEIPQSTFSKEIHDGMNSKQNSTKDFEVDETGSSEDERFADFEEWGSTSMSRLDEMPVLHKNSLQNVDQHNIKNGRRQTTLGNINGRENLYRMMRELFESKNLSVSSSPSARIFIEDKTSVELISATQNSNSQHQSYCQTLNIDGGLNPETLIIRKAFKDRLMHVGRVFGSLNIR